MGKIVLLLLLSLSFNAFAIRNGVKVDRYQNPNLVRITNNSSICSGTRVSYRYVLTAAHCFRDKKKSRFSVSYIFNGKIKSKRISKSKVRILTTSLDRELAVFPLFSERQALDTFKPFAIYPYQRGEEFFQKTFKILGFGYTQSGSVEKLRSGELAYHSEYHPNDHIDPMMLMTSNHKNNLPCPGDSGGPMFVTENGQTYLVGVVSFISSTKESIARLSEEKQCKKGNRAAYIPVNLHMSFVAPYLD